jgi:hypothetical protein
MAELEIIDGDGRRRRGRPGEKFADGERAVFPPQGTHAATRELMDAMRAHAVVVDAHGFPAGFRRGFCFANSKHRDAAAQRYLQRKIDLHNASHVDHNPTPSLDKLRALADRAYEDRKQRIANAWRD